MNELTGWCFVRVFQSPSFRLPSSRLCGVCSCLVVQKDDVEAQESAPPPQQTPSISLCVIMIIIIKRHAKALWSLHDGVFCTLPRPALHVVHFTAHRTCLWLAR